MSFFVRQKSITPQIKSMKNDLILSLSEFFAIRETTNNTELFYLSQLAQRSKNHGLQKIITPYFIEQFLARNDFNKKIKKDIQTLDIHNPSTIRVASARIIRAIMHQPLSSDLRAGLTKVATELNCKNKKDSVFFRLFFTSHEAGNYHVLTQNEFLVTKKNIEQIFKRAIAQFYTAELMLYRERHGFAHVNPSVGLIVYTRSPRAKHFVFQTSYQNKKSHMSSLVIKDKTTENFDYLLFKPNLQNGQWPVLNLLPGKHIIPAPILAFAAQAIMIETAARISFTITGYFDQGTENLSIVGLEKNTPITLSEFSEEFFLTQKSKPIAQGTALGKSIGVGVARMIRDERDYKKYKPGEIVVTKKYSAQCLSLVSTAAGFIFESSHVPAEFITQVKNFCKPCIVNVKHTTTIKPGRLFTLSCAQSEDGLVYAGALPYELKKGIVPRRHKTKIDSVDVFIDHIITDAVKVHPLFLCQNQSTQSMEKYTTAIFSAVAQAAGLNYPHSLTIAFSSASRRVFENLFKGKNFEKKLKLRSGAHGAERYLCPGYKSVVAAECQALVFLKEKMRLNNVRLQLPYCRSPFELEKFLALLGSFGITRANGWEFSLRTDFPGHGLLTKYFALQVDTLILDIDTLVPAIMGERVGVVTPEMQKIVETVLSQIVRTARATKTNVAVSGMLLLRQPKLVFSSVKSGVKSVIVPHDHMPTVRASIIEAEHTVGNTGYTTTNHRWLGLVAGIASFGALLMSVGAGCGVSQLVYPERNGGVADTPPMTPAQIRAEVLSSITAAQQESAQKSLTESIVNSFAHFKITYPKSWIAEFRPDEFILRDSETTTTIRFYQHINPIGSVTTTVTTIAPANFVRQVTMPNNSILEIESPTSSEAVNQIVSSLNFLIE